jgi:putative MATE family efflux protein
MKDLSKGSIGRHLLEMAGFIFMGMFVQTLYFIVDLYFVSRLGPEAVAGVNQGGNFFFIVLGLTQVLGVSSVALISQAVGRKDHAEANLVFNQSVVQSALSGALVLLIGYTVGDRYMHEVSANAATAAAGRTYLFWYLPGLGLQFALVVMSSALRGTGIVKPAMAVQSLTLILNIVLAPVLIAGWGTGHPLGVAGAALASSIAIAVGVLLLAAYFVRLEKYVAFKPASWRPHWPTWKRMLKIGLPAGGEFLLMFVIVTTIYRAIRPFGADAQAGVAIGVRCMQSIFLPAMAVAFAVAPIAGQNFGARLAGRVRATFNSAVLMGTVIMVALTVLCQLEPDLLVRVFSKDASVVAVGATYLRITSWNFVANGIAFTCSGMFQGLGNTWPSFLSSGMRLVTYVLPMWWLAQQPWVKIEHFWYLSVATIALQAVTSYLLLRREMRTRLAFPEPAAEAAVATS